MQSSLWICSPNACARARVSGPALRILGLIISLQHRDGGGTLVDTTPRALGATYLAQLLKLPRSTAAAALKELIAEQHLIVVEPAAGRRPTKLQVAKGFQQFGSVARQKYPLSAES